MTVKSPLFEVLPPLSLPVESNGRGKWVHVDKALQHVKEHEAADRKGIYVFCSPGYGKPKPWYVGRATKSFAQEVLAPHKVAKLQEAVARSGSKKMTIQFIVLPKQKGSTNTSAIVKLETYLIQQCSLINGELLNKKSTKVYMPRIKGVMNSPPGPPTKAAKAVRDMLE